MLDTNSHYFGRATGARPPPHKNATDDDAAVCVTRWPLLFH